MPPGIGRGARHPIVENAEADIREQSDRLDALIDAGTPELAKVQRASLIQAAQFLLLREIADELHEVRVLLEEAARARIDGRS